MDVTIAKSTSAQQPASEEEIAQRLRTAATIADWIEATRLLPAGEGGYDIVTALNENRIWSGERPLIPDEVATP